MSRFISVNNVIFSLAARQFGLELLVTVTPRVHQLIAYRRADAARTNTPAVGNA